MAESGYRVTALSPDKNHKQYFERAQHPNISFHNLKFEDLHLDEKFDLVLMSESQNYFDADEGFRQCRRFLKDRGHLLVCGMFRHNDSSVFKHVRNIESEYVAKAARHKLELAKRVDITERVLPTLELANEASREYLAPAYNVVKYYFEHSSPLKLRLFKMFCSKELKNLSKIYHYYREFFDPALFKERVMYLTLLFNSSP
jgi:ubiquinone/menaquinone biosynthesis C-methylase UbiE